ncbi:flavin reductase [Mycobacterium kyogaense]|uniref:flavin reductase n=1 Tax=Mycobacterium kyogaense TaxID=2212479 RepID=UPI000DAEE43F|nr:flavin reductase [Mycobacterium kyogaense]
MTEPLPSIDSLRYREVMGHYPTGVTVVTGIADDGEPVGMVVGTFTSVSLDPPLVAFLPTLASRTFARLRTARSFCINVLAHDQVALCRTMASPAPDKFADVEWSASSTGAPAIAGAVAHIDCVPRRAIEAGDHFIQLCEVESMEVHRQVTPLLFFQGGYGGFSPHSMTAGGDADLISGVRLADLARPQIESLAGDLACEAAVLVAVNEFELTTVSTAHGGTAVMRELLGERLPMKPPLGEAYMAWASDDAAARWLTMVGKDPDRLGTHRQRLAAIRARGYAAWQVASGGSTDQADVAAMMIEYAAGGLTPTRERELLARMAEYMPSVDTADFADEQVYDIGGLMAPVLGKDGNVVLLLRLAQLPTPASGEQIKRWASDLRGAAAQVEARLLADTTAARGEYAR